MEGANIYRGSGAAVGILAGLLICLILFRYINRDKSIKTKYDERQEAVRGKAYMYGFWASMIGAAIVICTDCAGIVIANRFAMDFFIIFVGILVQVTYSIWNDGYYGINTNKKRFYLISLAAGIINLLVVAAQVREGTFIVNGVMSDSAVNLMCVILFLFVAAELIMKDAADKKREASEESED